MICLYNYTFQTIKTTLILNIRCLGRLKCPMKKECPEIVTKNVRVYLEMSGKCLSFDPKNDQIFRPDFFWWFEYPENIRNMWEFFFSIFFNMENIRNTYEFFQFFQYGNCPEFLYGKCPEYVWNINSGQILDKTKILDMKNFGKVFSDQICGDLQF